MLRGFLPLSCSPCSPHRHLSIFDTSFIPTHDCIFSFCVCIGPEPRPEYERPRIRGEFLAQVVVELFSRSPSHR